VLKADADVADIPVVTCSTSRIDTCLEDPYSALIGNALYRADAAALN
jgi:hypothetical protein